MNRLNKGKWLAASITSVNTDGSYDIGYGVSRFGNDEEVKNQSIRYDPTR